jgi:hypothetical protein
MPVPTNTSEKAAFRSESRPSSKSSDSESMSETWREITFPDVYLSWKATDSHWKWLKTLARSSRTTWLPIRPRTEMKDAVAVAWTVIAAKKPTTTMMIGTTSWVLIRAGTLSTPTPISHGPAKPARLAISTSSAMSATVPRCGRSRLASSARLRRRRSSDSPFGTSAASSAAMPRHAWVAGALT